MFLQVGPRFTVPFVFTAGFGLLLALAGVAIYLQYGGGDDRFDARTYQSLAASLAGFGLGLVALALDFAGAMATLQTGLDRPDSTPMEPTLLGDVGRAAPWEMVALVLFVLAALAALVAVAALVRRELQG